MNDQYRQISKSSSERVTADVKGSCFSILGRKANTLRRVLKPEAWGIKRFFITMMAGLGLGAAVAQASSNLVITPVGTVQYRGGTNDPRTLSYRFKVTNRVPRKVNQGLTLIEWVVKPGASLGGVSLMKTDCPFIGESGEKTGYLKPAGQADDHCFITLKSRVPRVAGRFTAVLSIADGLGGNSRSTPFGVTVTSGPGPGYFVFRKDGKDRSKLDLKPGDSGSVTLHNTGGTAITGYSATLPAKPVAGYFGGTCTTVKSLGAGENCILSYNIPIFSPSGSYTVQAQGTGAENSPIRFTVNIASAGHFVFRKDGKDISKLDLKQDDSGSVTLHNTGGTAIQGYTLSSPSSPVGDYFAGNCLTEVSLPAGASCTLTYKIPKEKPTVGNYTFKISGPGADNSPALLAVNIASQGHFVLRRSGTPISALNLAPDQKGSVTLHNTGGTDITGYAVSLPAEPVKKYFGGDCTTVKSLATGANCILNYAIPAANPKNKQPQDGAYTVQFSGTGADNSPLPLPVNIASKGHFVFLDGDGKSVTRLDLNPGESGSVTLHNTGGKDITAGYSLTIPAAIAGYFGGDCKTVKSLATGANCTLTYAIPASAKIGHYTVQASGTGADNSPATFTVNIASAGHFAFYLNKSPVSTLSLRAGENGRVTLYNNGLNDIFDYSLIIPPAIKDYFSGTCKTVTVLSNSDLCELKYSIPSIPKDGTYTIQAKGTGADNSPISLVTSIFKMGHFVFRDSNGKEISKMDLKPGDKGKWTLINTGEETIQRYALNINPSSIQGYFTGSCLSKTSLNKDESCILDYTIPSNSAVDSDYTVQAQGLRADNDSVSIKGHLSSVGHLVFRNSSGTDIIKLDLNSNTSGHVMLHNTGGISITAYTLTMPSQIDGSFSGNCKTLKSLPARSSCNLNYTIFSSVPAGTYTIQAKGTGVDNSPISLPVKIITKGRFVFRDNSGKAISNLDLGPGQTGSVTLHNTGGTTITDYTLAIPSAAAGYFSGDCTIVKELATGKSCTLKYGLSDIPNFIGKFTIVADGTGADRSRTLNLTVKPASRIWVGSGSADKLFQCRYKKDETLDTCSDTGAKADTSYGLFFDWSGVTHGVVYTVDKTNKKIRKCSVIAFDGSIKECTSLTLTTVQEPSHISGDASQKYVFISDVKIGDLKVHKCLIKPDGTLGSCSDISSSIPGLDIPQSIKFTKDKKRIFIVNKNSGASTSTIITCANNAGTLSSCKTLTISSLGVSHDIALSPDEKRIFVVDTTNKEIKTCEFSSLTAEITNCASAITGLNDPWGIQISKSGTVAFYSEFTQQKLKRCTLNKSTGAISACANAAAGAFSKPVFFYIRD